MTDNLEALNNGKLFSHSSGGQKFRVKVWAGLFPLRALRENPSLSLSLSLVTAGNPWLSWFWSNITS